MPTPAALQSNRLNNKVSFRASTPPPEGICSLSSFKNGIVIISRQQSLSFSSPTSGMVQPAQSIFTTDKKHKKWAGGGPVTPSGCGVARKRKLQSRNWLANALGLPWFF